LLELELAEKVIFKDAERAMNTAYSLLDLGVGIILDDFGSSYASLAHMQRIPFTALKVDKTCLEKFINQSSDNALKLLEIAAFVGQKLGKRIMAEGVETEAQHRVLVQLEYDVVQGFYYDKPVHHSEAQRLLLAFSDNVALEPSDAFEASLL
jgi:EAL domain-containing protein (putative c-di-GMP-specific phosphodiesterase class I)